MNKKLAAFKQPQSMAAFNNVPRQTMIGNQPHMLAYINPEEEALIQSQRGGMPAFEGPGGVPAFAWYDVFSGSSTTTTDTSNDDDKPGFFESGGALETWVDKNVYDFDGDQSGVVSSNNDDSYTVSANDTLSNIAQDNNMSVGEIVAANPEITNPDQIQVDQVLDLSGANSGSSTYDGGVGAGGIGSGDDTSNGYTPEVITTTELDGKVYDPDTGFEIRSLPSGTEYYVDPATGLYEGLVNGFSTTTTTAVSGYDDLDGALTNIPATVTSSTDTGFMMDDAVDQFYNQETNFGNPDDSVVTYPDFSQVSGDSRTDLAFDMGQDGEPLVTGNGVNFTGTYGGVTYVNGFPKSTNPLRITIDESTYVDPLDAFGGADIDTDPYGQDTFESTFLANYGVPVPTSESEFMALPDGAKTDLALLPSDDIEDLLQTISTTSGDNSSVVTTLFNYGADLFNYKGLGDDPLYKVVKSDDVNLLPPATEISPLNVEIISTEDFNKIINGGTDSSVVGGYDEAGLNAGGDVGATDDDLATDFSAFDTTGTDSSVVGGYDEAGLNVNVNNIGTLSSILETTDNTDGEVGGEEVGQTGGGEEVVGGGEVFVGGNGGGEVVGGEVFVGGEEGGEVFVGGNGGGEEGGGEVGPGGGGEVFVDPCPTGYSLVGAMCVADNNVEEVTTACPTGYTLTGGVCVADNDETVVGPVDEDPVDEDPVIVDPVDSYSVENQFAVRDLVDDFQRRRKSGMGYGLPQYMQRYMSGNVVDELVRRVELEDGSVFYVTPDGRYLDPEEFIGTAALGDVQSIKTGDERYQTGYTTTNLTTGETTTTNTT